MNRNYIMGLHPSVPIESDPRFNHPFFRTIDVYISRMFDGLKMLEGWNIQDMGDTSLNIGNLPHVLTSFAHMFVGMVSL